MSWVIEHRAKEGMLWITTQGVHTPEDVRRLALDAIGRAKVLGVMRILVDDRKMTPDFRTLDLYKMPRNYEKWGAPKGLRVATVYSGASPQREDFRFYELASANFGDVAVRVFEDSAEEALDWL